MCSRRKTYLDATTLRELVAKQVGPHCGTVFSLYVADGKYYCPPRVDVEAVLGGAKVHEASYIAETHDCDDFCHLAMSAFITDAYRQGKRRPAYAFGIIFTMGHAFNWFVDDSFTIWTVEPQTAEISRLSDLPPGEAVVFMLV
jgi:hypothetical protein